MPTDAERWKEVMIESGQMPDDNGIWRYNPQAIKNPYGLEQQYDLITMCGYGCIISQSTEYNSTDLTSYRC